MAQAFNETRSYQEIDRLNSQVRGLNNQVNALRSLVERQGSQLQNAIQAAAQTTGVSNLINNTDFAFSEAGYYGWAWANAGDTLSQWYRQQNTGTTQIDENDSVAVSTSGHQVTLTSTPAFWDRDKGLLVLSGDDAVYAPLPKNYALPGISLFVRFAARSRSGGGTVDALKFRVSIWENTATPKIGETTVFPALGLSLSPLAAAGAFTRTYILVSVDSQQRKISSASANITIDVSAGTVDTDKYVEVSWNRQKDAVQYLLYRTEDGTNWYQIAVLQGGITSFNDQGGLRNLVAAPTASQKAEVSITSQNVALREDVFTDVTVRLRVPVFYQYLSTDKQFLRVDLVDDTGALISAPVDIDIDRVLFATSLGKWTPSAADANAVSNIETPDPDPVDDNPFNPDPYGYQGNYYNY